VTAFEDRAKYTDTALKNLATALTNNLGSDGARILGTDTCIYVVGSGGRGEMSEHSDVDLFVARIRRPASDVDAFQVLQAITRAFFERGLPDPSQGGDFLRMHTAQSLCERMGTPDDDATNTFTARMLLLLESQPLLGDSAYVGLIEKILDAYWQNVEGHEADYQPYVLVNDVVRYWRILLLNYVAKNAVKELELEQPTRDAERRLRSYKLRFSRCITCFSTLAKLLAVTTAGSVTREHVLETVRQRPTDRLREIAMLHPRVEPHVTALLERYDAFLARTSASKNELIEQFQNNEFRSARSDEARAYGDAMFELVQTLGSEGRAKDLFRHLVV